MDNYKLYRCKFIKVTKEYIIGKDIFTGKTYKIVKNSAAETFKVGFDDSFYAKALKKSFLSGTEVIEPIKYSDYLSEC
ncbi:hypothetical protein [Clostridium sp.]|uniref:hypothetical protein n=1 Tax=Clostridium sp. TaxID=1506 RepID=UPI001B492567|nr:hypothetical protein [Clostridium sp.]MBP3916623.1 hypothetical protein [Clostridium sp.]